MNLEEKVDKLKKETIALRKEMIIMKTLVKEQNGFIKMLLEQTQSNEVGMQCYNKTKDWFPLRTQEDLDEFEKSVNCTNRKEIIYEARFHVHREGVSQTLHRIFDEKLIMNYNLDGNYNKRRLLDYENLMDVLFKATQVDGWTQEKFICEFRKGIRKIKKKQHKLNRKHSLEEWSEFQKNQRKSDNTSEEDDDDDDDDDGDDDDGEDDYEDDDDDL